MAETTTATAVSTAPANAPSCASCAWWRVKSDVDGIEWGICDSPAVAAQVHVTGLNMLRRLHDITPEEEREIDTRYRADFLCGNYTTDEETAARSRAEATRRDADFLHAQVGTIDRTLTELSPSNILGRQDMESLRADFAAELAGQEAPHAAR